MNTEHSKSDRGLWLAWFLASSMGYSIGAILGLFLAYGLFNRDPFDIIMGVTLGTVMGVTGGYFQWVVLRARIAGVGLWGLASALGFGLAMGAIVAANTGENSALAGVLIASVFGLASGILQCLILRRKVARAGWWLLANLFGSLVGAMIALPIATVILDAGKWLLGVMTLGLVFGAGNGAITGAALVWLLRPSESGSSTGTATQGAR